MEEHTEIAKTKHEKKGHEELQLTIQGAVILAGLMVAAAIIGGAFIIVHGPFSGGTSTTSSTKATVAPDITKITVANTPYIGNPNAKTVLAYWSDYQCPVCKLFEETTFQSLLKDYVETGKTAIVFKDYSFLGPDSTVAALYARAIWELYPEKYFAWREAMFQNQDAENSGFGDEASVMKLTGTITGIDAAKVQKQVIAKQDVYQKMIDTDRSEAVSMGAGGTPAFLIGKKLISGNAKYDAFTSALDAQLK